MVAPCRVLLVCFNRLVPADQGNARRVQQLLALYKRQGFEVDLLYHDEEGHDAGLSQALTKQFGRVLVMPSRARKRIDAQHMCRVADWYDPALEVAAHDLHRLRGYRLVHVNYIWYAPLLRSFGPDVLKVLDSHDIFADRAGKHLAAGMAPAWFSTTVQEEDAAFALADVVLAIQKDEAREMAQRGHRHILYLPWVEPTHADFLPRLRGPEAPEPARGVLTLGYLGSGNMWNVRSLRELAAALARRLGNEPPPFQLVVAGGLSRHLPRQPGLVPYGYVHELGSFYRAVDVALNPMVGGTGLKIKTVEPLAHGCPVLSTRSGAQGLEAVWALPLFDSPEELVDFLLRELARDPEAWLPQLRAQALASRTAFLAEHDQQAARFESLLAHRVPRRVAAAT